MVSNYSATALLVDTQLHRNMVSSYSATDLLVDTQLHWNMVSNYSATDLLVDTQLHRADPYYQYMCKHFTKFQISA